MTEQLQSIINEINSLSLSIGDNELVSERHSKIILGLNIKRGQQLAMSKGLVAGNWETWVRDTFKDKFSLRTAYNLIRLFENMNHVSGCISTRQAYKVIRNLQKNPETLFENVSTPQPPTEPEKNWSLEKEIKRPVNKIIKLLKQYHVEKKELLEVLKPIVKYYNKQMGIKDNKSITLERVTRLAVNRTRKKIMDENRTFQKFMDTLPPIEPVQPPHETARTE